MYRNTYVEINLDDVKYNANFFYEKNHKKVIGVVKADGYGIDDVMEAKALKEVGVDYFAVSSLDEALHLRNNDINDDILILGYVSQKDLDIVKDNNFTIVTVSKDYVIETDLTDIKVILKLNTGMNRLGVKPQDSKQVLDLLIEKRAIVEGIMSHYSSSDCDLEYSNNQYNIFKQCVEDLNYPFKYIHIAATDGSIAVDDDISNCQRIGIGLLGYSSYETALKPCLSLYSEVSMVKQLNKGETVSYGRHYTSDGNGYILTVPIGYADGIRRDNSGKQVYVEDEYGIIVGSVCMDQMMILTEHYHPVGSKVEIYGKHIDIKQRAQQLNTITYELLTNMSDRITRIYYKDNKKIAEFTPRFK